MWSNVFDDVADFEVCGFINNTKIWISWEQNTTFSPDKKIHTWYIKGYNIEKNNFLVEATFKVKTPKNHCLVTKLVTFFPNLYSKSTYVSNLNWRLHERLKYLYNLSLVIALEENNHLKQHQAVNTNLRMAKHFKNIFIYFPTKVNLQSMLLLKYIQIILAA